MSKHIATQLIRAGAPVFNEQTAPVSVPVVRTSTVRFENAKAYDDIHHRRAAGETVSAYGRHGMQTHRALEAAINALEYGRRCFLTPSGLAAISLTFLSLLSPGDHVLIADNVYAPVRRLHKDLLQRLQVEVDYFSPNQHNLETLIKPNTKLVYAESPGSLLFEVLDLPQLAATAHRHGLLLACDNTWASGYLQQPLTLGAHVSILASTKYIAGHSDLMQGAVVVNDPALALKIARTYDAFGLTIGADDAALALRGIRTLPVRMAQHQRNALQVAEILQTQPEIKRVFYPALPSDPGHRLWQRDFSGANGLVSFEFKNADPVRARTIVDALQLFSIGASWGGYESLVQIAAPERLAQHSHWSGSGPVIRLHIGLEQAQDLIDDLQQAFSAASRTAASA